MNGEERETEKMRKREKEKERERDSEIEERVLQNSSMFSRSDVGVPRECSRDRMEHIYAESAIGIGYRYGILLIPPQIID